MLYKVDIAVFFFFRMAYLNAWLTSFVGYTLLCSLLGEPRGVDIIHPLPYVWLSDHFTGISPCSFARSEVGSLTCIGCDSPIHHVHGTDGLIISLLRKTWQWGQSALPKGATAAAGFELMRNLQYGSSRSIHWRLDHSPTTAPILDIAVYN